jgi:hypothetical protein
MDVLTHDTTAQLARGAAPGVTTIP